LLRLGYHSFNELDETNRLYEVLYRNESLAVSLKK
jgi:hypothetical protein